MITLIVGRPKHGKTGWLQMKIEELYFNRRRELYKSCCAEIDKDNDEREIPFKYPDYKNLRIRQKILRGYAFICRA